MILKNQSTINVQYGNPFPMNKNESKELTIDWERGYGKLTNGKYRIVKDFSYEENEKLVSFIKYLEFEIK